MTEVSLCPKCGSVEVRLRAECGTGEVRICAERGRVEVRIRAERGRVEVRIRAELKATEISFVGKPHAPKIKVILIELAIECRLEVRALLFAGIMEHAVAPALMLLEKRKPETG